MSEAIVSWLSMIATKLLASVDGTTGIPPIEKGVGAGKAVYCFDIRRFVLVTMPVLLDGLRLLLLRMYQLSAVHTQDKRKLKAVC